MSNDTNMVQAIYTFKGKNNDELCFKKGDIITVTQREEGGWWEGTLGETTGWFPSNYVKEFKDVNGSATTSPVRTPAEVQNFRNVVLKDIIDSEKAHVAELQGLIINFLQPLEKSDILTKDEYKQLTGNILEILNTHEELLALVEECGSKTGADQRVGGLFLQWAPKIKSVHQTYCGSHPRAVCILDKYKEELNNFMEKCGAVCPGILVLTTGLSKPFRRLDKYAAMLQELGRHVLESHPDRGDTHRAVAVYKDIASTCAATRRQKELELQVVTGAVRGWQSIGGAKDLASLGEVLHMGGVALGDTHADRYFVLFPSTLLILSVSRRMSAFVYEGCLPLTGISVTKLEDTENRKNAFEIRGALIDSIVAVCQSNADAEKWVSLLSQHLNPDIRNTMTSGSLPHSLSQMSPTDSSPNSTISGQGNTNHKRSHSFNNHHSYTQYLYQQQKQKSFQSDKNNWIQSSCDAISAQNTSPINSSRITATSSFSSKISDFSQKFSPNSVHEGWSIKNLRPAPPLRPLAASSLNEDSGSNNVNPYAPMQRKINSYEEDALILRVIEAYCTSARSRKAVNSEWEDDIAMRGGKDWLVRSPSLPLHNMSRGPPSLLATVVNLQTEVKYLKNEMKLVRAEMDEYRQERILSNVAALAPNGAILRDAKESNC